MPRVVVVSPPFSSHAQPLTVLGAALREAGAEVHLACAPAFAGPAHEAGLGFAELTVTRNANHGIAERTVQDHAEAARLTEFLAATREGAVPALLTQARHRRADLLADPERVLADLADLHDRLRPDWYLVDQLSYPVTLALHCLGLPFATFCPGHPSYLPSTPDAFFGLPYAWPKSLRPSAARLAELRTTVEANDLAFTRLFTRFVGEHAPGAAVPGRAFALCSPHAVVFNYPRLRWLPAPPAGPAALYAGHCTRPDGPNGGLDPQWAQAVRLLGARERPIVLVALGTFLSARDDVLRGVAEGVLRHAGDVSLIMAAGARVDALRDSPALRAAGPDRVRVAASVPQQALLPHVGAMVHHGGNNSFTECLRAGVPAVLLPFSSDQFAVAHDAELAGAGICLDPNTLRPQALGAAVAALLARPPEADLGVTGPTEPTGPSGLSRPPEPSGLSRLTAEVRAHGPEWAAERLLAVMDRATTAPD
ncbi:glycosyltransferase [Kitasatospora sp. NBC_00315]|uniref:glycosyltransferase n=1 Tax=Kitasatospora sp. NBC_00315 TaxID=2975963 RepID=UPI003243BB38